jgi:hypothetical protein
MRHNKKPSFWEGIIGNLLFTGLETISAVYRTVFPRFKRNLGGYTAIGAYDLMQFPRTVGVILLFTGIAAGFATARLIGKSATGVKLLLSGGENKFGAALTTYHSFVLILHQNPLT